MEITIILDLWFIYKVIYTNLNFQKIQKSWINIIYKFLDVSMEMFHTEAK